MTKILFVCNCTPFEYGGGSQATTAYLDAVLDIYGRENVDVLCIEGMKVLEGYKDINYIYVPSRTRLTSMVGMLRGVMGRFAEPAYKLLYGNPDTYSLCIYNCGRESGWVAKRVKNLSVKFATIHHNQEVEYCMDNKTMDTLGGRYGGFVFRAEKDAYKYSDYNLFLTQQDLKACVRMYGHTDAKNLVIGTYDFKLAEIINLKEEKKEFDIVISGSLSSYQTEHGILDFNGKYYPIVLKHLPEAKILMTGRKPTAKVCQVASEAPYHYSIIPSPVDIHKEVRRAKIYFCPTDIGGGLKLRAMDGLKNGLPILIHAVSARGYDAFFDKPYFKTYKDEESFEKGLREILDYIASNENYPATINHDYYSYFGYEAGKERIKSSLE